MDSHLIVDFKRFEVIDQAKLTELKTLLDEKNIDSKDLSLILSTLKIPEAAYKPCKYTKLPNKIPFVRGRARIRIANKLINLKVRKW